MDKKIIKELCGICNTQTNCDLIMNETTRFDDEPFEVTLRVTKCHGCGNYTVKEVTVLDDDYEEIQPNIITPIPHIKIVYPSSYNHNQKTKREHFVESFKTKINEYESCCPSKISWLLNDCLTAYEKNLNILAIVGFRMIVDSICQEKKENGEISKAIRDKLLDEGYISVKQKDVLEKIVDFGNVAAHQFKILESKNIEACFNVIETLLKNIYHLPEINKKLPDSENNRR